MIPTTSSERLLHFPSHSGRGTSMSDPQGQILPYLELLK